LIAPGYALVDRIPTVAEYCALRIAAGLSPRSADAATAGLPNTFVGMVIEHDGEAIGMGRVIGDGGLMFQIVDIAVRPEHQGKELGKAIMAALTDALAARVPAEAYVSLIADGDARHLYAQYGFADVAPASIGMARWLR